ncbi:MAG: type II toxin-antitoxin system RelE/ParE family toxin [Bacteroidales bacterium]|nr:type II toxin-antitoxin system RelE/ParE family toxin [Bacteroidales bacterium]
MKVIWSERAGNIFSETAEYIQNEYGDKERQKFIQRVLKITKLLENNPNLGIVEPRLKKAPVEYRSYCVDHINRIVYFVEDNYIKISDFWDMRRNPKTLANRLLK